MEKTINGVVWRKIDFLSIWKTDDGWTLYHRADGWRLDAPLVGLTYRLKSNDAVSDFAMEEASFIIVAQREQIAEVQRMVEERKRNENESARNRRTRRNKKGVE